MIKRIYHHHEKWEEVEAGMWAATPSQFRKMLVDNAVDFTGDHVLYGSYMLKVIKLWPYSCEHNLTAISTNRRAWVGHAACCMAIGVAEDVTREAWHYLTKKQQDLANGQATIAIKQWEINHRIKNAKDTSWNRCSFGGEGEDSFYFRPIQQNLFEFFRREGQHCNASPCNG
jgi:hypothetical protein